MIAVLLCVLKPTHATKMSAVIQMPPAIDASIRACCTEAVQQAVAVLAAKYEFDAEEATRELKLDELKLERKRGPAPKSVAAAAKKTKNVTDKPKKAKTGYLLFCDEVRAEEATLAVEPREFWPGRLLCYISAPDNVNMELIQAEPADTYR